MLHRHIIKIIDENEEDFRKIIKETKEKFQLSSSMLATGSMFETSKAVEKHSNIQEHRSQVSRFHRQ